MSRHLQYICFRWRTAHFMCQTGEKWGLEDRETVIGNVICRSRVSAFGNSPSTASGTPRYRRSACIDTDMLRLAAAACCDMGWISAQRCVLCDRCDTVCQTFQLPHITIGSFQSHRRQSTTGSLQSLQRLKERKRPSVRWKSFAFHKLAWWHFHFPLQRTMFLHGRDKIELC